MQTVWSFSLYGKEHKESKYYRYLHYLVDILDSGQKKGSNSQSLNRKKTPGTVLLSHSHIYSTLAAGALNDRVRDGNECFSSAMDAGKNKQS